MVFLFSFWHLSLALHTNHKFKTLFPQSRFTKHNSNLTSQNNQQSHLKLGLKKMVTDSLVMKLMNSETHSCMVSLAILPLAGNAFFMILLILAIGKYRSCSLTPANCGLCSPPLSWLPPAGLVEASAISLALPKFKTEDHCSHTITHKIQIHSTIYIYTYP
jgi:hypothetical protein